MKKTLILGILGLAASAVSTYGQGAIALDNYQSTAHPLVMYGGAATGGTAGTAILFTGNPHGVYTAGLYYVNASGDNHNAFTADATGMADPTTLYTGPGTLTLAPITGIVDDPSETGVAGEYSPSGSFNPGLGGGVTVTVMVIAYDGASYASAFDRAHSTAFTMTTAVGSFGPNFSGDTETDGGFQVHAVPEPSVLALSGLGAAALMAFRRKKQA